MGIHLLPPELVDAIASSLEVTTDLKNLRCVCKRIKNVVDPILFSDIWVEDLSLLEGLALGDCSASSSIAPHVRTLRIGNLGGISARQLKRYFRPALESLTEVRRVIWNPFRSVPPWKQHAIIQQLGRMEHLTELSLILTFCRGLTLPIERLTCPRLTTIKVWGHWHDESHADALATFLSNHARTLQHISLDANLGGFAPGHNFDSERAIFDSVFNRACFTATLHPTIVLINIPARCDRILLSGKFDLHALSTLAIGGFSAEGWRAFQAARVRLRNLYVNEVTEECLSYLESYGPGEGIERLRIHVLRSKAPSSRLVEPFYHSVLRRHENTLKALELEIYGDVEDGWAVGMSHLDVLKRCTRLEVLALPFDATQMRSGSPSDIVVILLRFAVSHPSLTELALFNALPRGFTSGKEVVREAKETILRECSTSVASRSTLWVYYERYGFAMKPGSDRFLIETEDGWRLRLQNDFWDMIQ